MTKTEWATTLGMFLVIFSPVGWVIWDINRPEEVQRRLERDMVYTRGWDCVGGYRFKSRYPYTQILDQHGAGIPCGS